MLLHVERTIKTVKHIAPRVMNHPTVLQINKGQESPTGLNAPTMQ